MIRIVIAEDHELVREGIKKIIRPLRDVRVVGEACNIASTLKLIALHKPDVVTLDLSLNGVSELEGLVQIRQCYPHLPVLVLSMYPEERYAIRALKAGASGYVTKAMAAEEVVKGIRKIAGGGRYISQRLAEILAKDLANPSAQLPHTALTEREAQVLRLLGSGMQTKQVAAELSISVSSVNTYRGRIFKKMGLQSNAAVIRYAIEHGLIK